MGLRTVTWRCSHCLNQGRVYPCQHMQSPNLLKMFWPVWYTYACSTFSDESMSDSAWNKAATHINRFGPLPNTACRVWEFSEQTQTCRRGGRSRRDMLLDRRNPGGCEGYVSPNTSSSCRAQDHLHWQRLHAGQFLYRL